MAAKKNSKATKVTEATAAPAAPDAEEPDVPPPSDPKPKTKKKKSKEMCYEFVKNYVPAGEVVFEDGEKFTFPRNPFHTTDSKLADKIRKVAPLYKIMENSSTEA